MFSSKALIILVALDDFRDVVNVMAWGVGVVLEGVQFLVFWHLRDELLEVDFLVGLLIASSLLLTLLFPSSSRFQQLLLLFPLLLHVALHLCDLGLNEVELFMQLEVVLVLLLLQPLLFVEVWTAGVLSEFASTCLRFVLRRGLFFIVPLVPGGITLLVVIVLGPTGVGSVSGAVVSSAISHHVGRVVLAVLLLIAVALLSCLESLVYTCLGRPWGVCLSDSVLILRTSVVIRLPSAHLKLITINKIFHPP